MGLLGGSFNPPHEGHALVTRIALTRLRLDRVWWLVTPGNPLKSQADLAALQARVEAARRLDAGPRVAVTDIEAHIRDRYTYDTLAWLTRRAAKVRFVWIIGGGQPQPVPSLAPLAGDRRPRPDRRRRPPGSTLRAISTGRRIRSPLARPGSGGGALRRAQSARVPVPARAALRPVLDGAAGERLNPARGEMKAGRFARIRHGRPRTLIRGCPASHAAQRLQKSELSNQPSGWRRKPKAGLARPQLAIKASVTGNHRKPHVTGNPLYAPLPNTRPRPHGRRHRGRCGSLFLHRSGLALPTPRRPPGALSP